MLLPLGNVGKLTTLYIHRRDAEDAEDIINFGFGFLCVLCVSAVNRMPRC
jgi:hypothetical protein